MNHNLWVSVKFLKHWKGKQMGFSSKTCNLILYFPATDWFPCLIHCRIKWVESCCGNSRLFWNNFTEWLKNLNLLPRDYTLKNITALGLRPDISHFALLINYCFLLARYHIWLAKTKENQLNLAHFIDTVKSQYEIEIKSGDKKKWKPLAGYMRI